MYIYNVTINVEDAIHNKWLQWMKDKHIPDMLATGKFSKAIMTRVLVEGEVGTTYSVQYRTKDKATLLKYFTEDANKLRQEGRGLFGNQFVAFRTELDVVFEKSTFPSN